MLKIKKIWQSAAEPLSTGEGSTTIPEGSTHKRVETGHSFTLKI
jgi:hypothetical protein